VTANIGPGIMTPDSEITATLDKKGTISAFPGSVLILVDEEQLQVSL
jgi:hypothetical protein